MSVRPRRGHPVGRAHPGRTLATCSLTPPAPAPTPARCCRHLAGVDGRADPHLITAAARTAANIELRISASIAPYDVAAEQWFPAGRRVHRYGHRAHCRRRNRGASVPTLGRTRRVGAGNLRDRRGHPRVLPRRRRPGHRRPPPRAVCVSPVPRHRPAGDPCTQVAGRLSPVLTAHHRYSW